MWAVVPNSDSVSEVVAYSHGVWRVGHDGGEIRFGARDRINYCGGRGTIIVMVGGWQNSNET
jgi:hypothetical protein